MTSSVYVQRSGSVLAAEEKPVQCGFYSPKTDGLVSPPPIECHTLLCFIMVLWKYQVFWEIQSPQAKSNFGVHTYFNPFNACCSKSSAPYWSNPSFLIFWHPGTLALSREQCQSAWMSKIFKMVALTSMSKCKVLTWLAVKGINLPKKKGAYQWRLYKKCNDKYARLFFSPAVTSPVSD